MRVRRALSLMVAVSSLAGVTVACEPTLQQQSGVVIAVDSPALGRVDTFRLLTPVGEILEFDTTEMEFRAEFPASHLNEHKVLGDRIEVTFKLDGDRRVVTQLDDRDH